ncbi:MAG: N-acetyltransferase [Desulfovibrio sp.]|nr:N-acetyltransferase [Desulfovibrio sp.]
MPILMPRPGRKQLPIPEVRLASSAPPVIRPAKVSDVDGMSALINQYAAANVMLARGPQYLYEHIQDYMVIVAQEAANGAETVIACGSVHVLWADLAEIRSIAVHPGCERMGFGNQIVSALVGRCRLLGIPRVFVFTLADQFFYKCGFREFDRELLPPAVWVECSKCPKFYRCDEICMALGIDGAEQEMSA